MDREREEKEEAAASKARKAMSPGRKANSGSKMTSEQLEAMVAEFDREFIADTFGELPADAKIRHQRAERKRGRPRVGSGSKVISVTIEKTLLKRADRLAKQLGISRARLIAVGLLKLVRAAAPIRQER